MSEPVSDPPPAAGAITAPVPQTIANQNIDSAADMNEVETPATADPTWPVWYAFVTTWLLPLTTARRMVHVRLWKAWLVHVAAGVLAFFLANLLETGRGPLTILKHMVQSLLRSPVLTVFEAGLTGCAIEIGGCLHALVICPWGARDERLRDSIANGFRCAWLHTADALPVVLLFGTLAVTLNNMSEKYRSAHPYDYSADRYPTSPTTPGPSASSAERQAYQKQQEQYLREMKEFPKKRQERRREYKRSQPFLVRNQAPILVLAGITSSMWIFWTLFRGLVGRRPIHSGRPPTCEGCGYDLTMTPMDGRCPECARLVAESLGPQVRSGSRWERGSRVGLIRDLFEALMTPSRFGRTLRVTPRNRRYFILPLVFGVAGWIALAGSFAVIWWTQQRERTDGNFFVLDMEDMIIPAVSAYSTGFVLLQFATAMLLVLLVTLYYRWHAERNLGSIASQVVCYQSGFLLLWEALIVAQGVAIWQLSFWLWQQRWLTGPISLLLIFGPHLFIAAIWLWLISRATSAARYANR